jgi:hypothetical protein
MQSYVHVSIAYLVGRLIANVRGDAIYLYDHRSSAHFRFRVSRYADDFDKAIEQAIDNAQQRR